MCSDSQGSRFKVFHTSDCRMVPACMIPRLRTPQLCHVFPSLSAHASCRSVRGLTGSQLLSPGHLLAKSSGRPTSASSRLAQSRSSTQIRPSCFTYSFGADHSRARCQKRVAGVMTKGRSAQLMLPACPPTTSTGHNLEASIVADSTEPPFASGCDVPEDLRNRQSQVPNDPG